MLYNVVLTKRSRSIVHRLYVDFCISVLFNKNYYLRTETQPWPDPGHRLGGNLKEIIV